MSCFICMATTGLDECPKCGVYGCKSGLKLADITFAFYNQFFSGLWFNLGHIYHHYDQATEYCRPFKIVNSPEFGRHFIATRDILPLQEILLEKAAVIGPAAQAVQICLECLIPVELDGKNFEVYLDS